MTSGQGAAIMWGVVTPPTPLVGRDGSLEVLRAAVRRAVAGSPSVVLLSGDTGIGKTRLIRELVAAEDPVLLAGACVPVAGEPLPFAPLTQALRGLGAAGRLNLQLKRFPDLARLLPEIDPHVDDSGGSLGPASALGLFQSVLRLIDHLGAAGPVLLVVEDLHWADRSTLDLVRYLASNLTSERAILLVSVRSDAVVVGTPLAAWVAELARLETCLRVPLEPLTPEQTALLVGHLVRARPPARAGHPARGASPARPAGPGRPGVFDDSGRPRLRRLTEQEPVGPAVRRDSPELGPDPAFLESTTRRSAGNPLFAEHLVLRGDPGDDRLPATLHELLDARVRALPEATQSILRAAAVLRRPVTPALLAATAGTGVGAVETAVRPAIEQHVLALRPDDTLAFRYPAFAEVVYAALLPGERAALHRAAAVALEADVATGRAGVRDVVAGELARHWLGAGDTQKALASAIEAGAAAERMYAFADAHANFTRALTVLDDGAGDGPQASPGGGAEAAPGSDPSGPRADRVHLLTHAAQAASLVGDGDEAARLLESALTGTVDPETRASLLTRLGAIHYLAGRPAAETSYREALALVPAEESSILLARIHAGLALVGAAWSRLDDADTSATRGLAVATATGARREEGLIHNAMGAIASVRGDVDGGVDHLRQALDIAKEIGNPNDLATAYINLTHVLGVGGRTDEVVAVAAEGTTALTRVGLSRQSGSFLQANLAFALVDAGRLDAASIVIDEALTHHPRGITLAPVLTQAARIDIVRGDLDRAWERLELARTTIELENAPDAWLRDVFELSAEVQLWEGRAPAAYDLVLDGLRLVSGTDDARGCGVLVGLGFRALASDAEARHDPVSRITLRRKRADLEAAAAGLGHDQPTDAAVTAWRTAEVGRLERDNDPELWARAAGLWSALGRRFPAAYARWREAEARLDVGRDAEAVATLRTAHAEAGALGARLLVDELQQLAGWHRIDLLELLPAGSAADDGPSTPGLGAYGLTPREIEVLGLIARGATSGDVAGQLGISRKTAGTHIEHIYAKTGASSRSTATLFALRSGLLGALDDAPESRPDL